MRGRKRNGHDAMWHITSICTELQIVTAVDTESACSSYLGGLGACPHNSIILATCQPVVS